jgi:adenine-specific DNA-methyltransferase
MKYMGSKRVMLSNGLGSLLERELDQARTFVDLFTGSAAVAVHVASNFSVPVRAHDLQQYSSVLANAVLGRDSVFEWDGMFEVWSERAAALVKQHAPPRAVSFSPNAIARHRGWCSRQNACLITKAYGGHYFSSEQAVWFDSLRTELPELEPHRTVALAALIQTASQCAAAPGHTAQPFQPTSTAAKYLEDAWRRDVLPRVKKNLAAISQQHGRRIGLASVQDANSAAQLLQEGDVAFIDPPYSGVHYSRFYHVLETIASGYSGDVEGTGRYPAPKFRPRSKYSVSTESSTALGELFETISRRGARAIVTFPDHECSNGLSGGRVREIARRHFNVREEFVSSRFSTLGGTGKKGRDARKAARELILSLSPR